MLLLCQGVARRGLTLGLGLPVNTNAGLVLTLPVLGTHTVAYRCRNGIVQGGFHGKHFRSHRRQCNWHLGTQNFNSEKCFFLRVGQVRNYFQCASLKSTEFLLDLDRGIHRPWRSLNVSHVEVDNYMNTQSMKRFYRTHSEGPGWEVYPSTFNSSEKTRKFLKKLRSRQRALLMNELQILDKELNKDAVVEDQTMLLPPSRKQLQLVLLNNAVPFIGFGFLDNAIMIAAGDYIDWKIGAVLHLSTMAAAGLGNLISDLAGVVLAGYVEAFAARLGIPTPNLSLEQYEMKQSKLASSIGRCVGIAIGCLLGMFPLLFLNTDRDEDENEEEQVKCT